MDAEGLQSLVEDLENNIDDLEEALAPLVKTSLSSSTSKLPLLDKAKHYVLATYAIETILFSALRLNGVDAKSHPVYRELNRVKEYFAKIKTAESTGTKRSVALDKDAAGRFIKHGLAGNVKYDRERADRMARERTGAKRKLEDVQWRGTHTRFDGAAKRIRAIDGEDEVVQTQDGNEVRAAEASLPSEAQVKLEGKAAKQKRRVQSGQTTPSPGNGDVGQADVDGLEASADTSETEKINRAHADPENHAETLEALLRRPLRHGEGDKPKRRKRKSKEDR